MVTTIKGRNNSFSVENVLKLNKTLSIKGNALIDKDAFILRTKDKQKLKTTLLRHKMIKGTPVFLFGTIRNV